VEASGNGFDVRFVVIFLYGRDGHQLDGRGYIIPWHGSPKTTSLATFYI